jgi:hypothetical protein
MRASSSGPATVNPKKITLYDATFSPSRPKTFEFDDRYHTSPKTTRAKKSGTIWSFEKTPRGTPGRDIEETSFQYPFDCSGLQYLLDLIYNSSTRWVISKRRFLCSRHD